MGRHWRSKSDIQTIGCMYIFVFLVMVFLKFLFLVSVIGGGIWLGLKLFGVL